jgi:Cft2 family RNA processing exonuclease
MRTAFSAMPGVTFQSLLRSAEIGANCYVLDTGLERIVLDAGMHPKNKGLEALPDLKWLEDGTADAIIVTHAHLDHIGALPVLMRRHPAAQVFMTEITADLGSAMLHNSCNVMTFQREQEDIKEYPLFTHREVDIMERRWRRLHAGKRFEPGQDGARAEFFEAGHLPGSVGVKFDLGGLRVFYTGDVHFEDQSLQRAAAFPETDIDVLIMECTRGAAARAEDYSRQKESWRLAETIMNTVNRGGSVLMPVFAMGKTQEMLLQLHDLRRTGHLSSRIPIHIGGLSSRMTHIIDKHSEIMHRSHPGLKLLELDGLIRAAKGERDLKCAPGRIYAISSGMMTENTASNDFAFRFIDNPRNTVAFVGYADPASPAGALRRAAVGEKVKLHPAHAAIERRCDVESFDFSGHAPREQLVDYVKRVRPRKLLLVHGDEPAIAWMIAAVNEALPDTEVIVPQPGEKIRLD